MKTSSHSILTITALSLAAGVSSCQQTRDTTISGTSAVDVYFRSDEGDDDGSYSWFPGRYDGPLHYLGTLQQNDLIQLATGPESPDDDLPDMDCYVHIEFHTSGGIIPGQFCWLRDNGNIFTEKYGWVHCPALWNKVYALMNSKYSAHQRL